MTANIPPGRQRESNALLARMTDKKFNLLAHKRRIVRNPRVVFT